MVKRILLGLAAVAIVAAGVYIVNSRYFTPERERVRAVVNTLISHLGTDNVVWSVNRIRARLSDKYRHHGEGGGVTIDKALASQFVMSLKQRLVGFKADVEVMTISVSGDSAKVEILGRVTAGQRGAPGKRIEVMTDKGRNRVVIELQKEDGDWMVVGSERLSHTLPDPSDDD
jgi:hypothetical protein